MVSCNKLSSILDSNIEWQKWFLVVVNRLSYINISEMFYTLCSISTLSTRKNGSVPQCISAMCTCTQLGRL